MYKGEITMVVVLGDTRFTRNFYLRFNWKCSKWSNTAINYCIHCLQNLPTDYKSKNKSTNARKAASCTDYISWCTAYSSTVVEQIYIIIIGTEVRW